MRRTARPLRAIDSSVLLCSWRQQNARPPCPRLGSPPAAFSTIPPRSFLLSGTQDKKKHQQFVRRWQKRILGDSEPIGARVDPYDPTSPVRIAPEETGEYEEVLDGEDLHTEKQWTRGDQPLPPYTPATKDTGLLRVGGDKWRQQKAEMQLASEFEKLTQRTYTPLTLNMANEIEELTGNPYTLKDENLLMAQTVHQVTGRPYTDHNFGLHRKPAGQSRLSELRGRFAQAVAEVHTLKEAGLDVDLSQLANRGIYEPPHWIDRIQLSMAEGGEPRLVFPKGQSAELFLQLMQTTPVWESSQAIETDDLIDEADAELLEPAQPPVMDPLTPEFKRAAVVKMDADKKPFDFMSNRPMPRVKPAKETKPEEDIAVNERPFAAIIEDFASAADLSKSTVNNMRIAYIAHQALHLTGNVSALMQATIHSMSAPSGRNMTKSCTIPPPTREKDVLWHHIPLNDDRLKFALFKRLYQLTGIRIADPQLTSASNYGDLYGYLCAAAAPRPKTLLSAIHIEVQKARRQAKRHETSQIKSQRKANLADLVDLGNVELRRSKPTETEIRTTTGINKVIQYALMERGLGGPGSETLSERTKKKQLQSFKRTQSELVFGRPVSSKGADLLVKATEARRLKRRENRTTSQGT